MSNKKALVSSGVTGTKHKLKEIEDLLSAVIICVYLVQKMGRATVDELVKKAAEEPLCASIEKHLVKRALNAAKTRQVLAMEKAEISKGKMGEQFYMKNMLWKSPPEMAYVVDLLPKILETEEAKTLKGQFESADGTSGRAPKGGQKAARGNLIDDYVNYQCLCYLADELFGSQPESPYQMEIRKDHGHDLKAEGYHIIDPHTGRYMIPQDNLQGWFKTNACRYYGIQDARADYIAFAPVLFPEGTRVEQMLLPVINHGQASAPKIYEVIKPGIWFWLNFSAPTKGFLQPDQLEKLLIVASARPRRGISPARGRRKGRFFVFSFEVLGKMKDPGSIDEIIFADGNMPESIAKELGMEFAKLPTGKPTAEHWKYLRDASTRLSRVSVKSTFNGAEYQDDDDDDVDATILTGRSSPYSGELILLRQCLSCAPYSVSHYLCS